MVFLLYCLSVVRGSEDHYKTFQITVITLAFHYTLNFLSSQKGKNAIPKLYQQMKLSLYTSNLDEISYVIS